ncbi:FKBP-type peptidyl-prolyl cis-trans isomerase [Microbacterium sp. STN6]|uniref:FKBP-type peptidyl-prolyl cis-trans isomerase n=1 Tax=Microbacterium sp. STN6 TaxID=2995588 RepID=UPI0022609E90|nr:FKBP-type peptidyl-prolyl cis-trans isomerase [Microbacterium sp. STN6]MCX7521566.1 FKBP-type peptidyl-prolyl cis-trans isomerase [Microbacterium sp. STN6]
MRRAPAMIVAAGLLLAGLTGCSSAPAADCTDAAAPGPASNQIQTAGALSKPGTANFATPMKTKTTERTIVHEGSGRTVQNHQAVQLDMRVYEGSTGALIPTSQYGGGSVTVNLDTSADGLVGGLAKGLICSTAGSRVVIATSPKDGLGDGATSLIIVVDVRKAYLAQADGSVQPHVAGMPQVVRAPNGQPGITIPKTDPPKTLKVAELLQGDGRTVKRGDNVVVQYTGLVWKTGDKYKSTWDESGPTGMLVDDASSASSGGSMPGLVEAMIGQKVGSQFIAVIPPSKAYGKQGSDGVPPDSTLVLVVDVLGIQ